MHGDTTIRKICQIFWLKIKNLRSEVFRTGAKCNWESDELPESLTWKGCLDRRTLTSTPVSPSDRFEVVWRSAKKVRFGFFLYWFGGKLIIIKKEILKQSYKDLFIWTELQVDWLINYSNNFQQNGALCAHNSLKSEKFGSKILTWISTYWWHGKVMLKCKIRAYQKCVHGHILKAPIHKPGRPGQYSGQSLHTKFIRMIMS